MKVNDEMAWAQQESELKSGDEASVKFLDFLLVWVGRAEDVLLGKSDLSPREALSKGFEFAEQTLGFLSVEWLGQMLLVIVQHWFHGEQLWESLSVWERRMVEQATALKLVELEEQAASFDAPEDSGPC